MTLAKRLKERMEELDITQDELATISRVSQTTIHKLFAGKAKESRKLGQIAKALRVRPQWLEFGEEPKEEPRTLAWMYDQAFKPNVIPFHSDDAPPPNSIQVDEYSVSFSAGNGHIAHYDLIEQAEPATYRLSWLQRERIKPENAKRFKVKGDSMEPFLFDGDTVLVNLEECDINRIIDGKAYAIRYGDELRIKRLFRKLDGTLTLRSDNPSYKDEDVPPSIAETQIAIIGRVRDKSGSGGC